MSLIKHSIKKKIQRERSEDADEAYANEIFVVCVLGGFIVAIIAAIADYAVAYGMFLSTVKNSIVAAGIAALLALSIQVIMGGAFKVAFGMYQRKEYEHGMSPIMWAAFLLSIIMFGGSSWLSFQPRQLVESRSYASMDLRSEDEVIAYYDKKESMLRDEYNKSKNDVKSEIDRLNNDKIMWRGKLTTRERSSIVAKNLSNNELPAIERRYEISKSEIARERSAAIDRVNSDNDEVKDRTENDISKNTNSVIGISIAANAIRLILMVVFISFVVASSKKSSSRNGTSHTVKSPPIKRQSNSGAAVPFSKNKAGFEIGGGKKKRMP